MNTQSRSKSAPSEAIQTPVIVCVDDEPAILRALERLFRDEPYEVLFTTEAQEAIDWIRSRSVSLVIADYRMPSMQGTDLLEQIAAISPDTRRILFTGYPGESMVLKGLGRGMYWLVGKPWNDDRFKATVQRLLRSP